MDPFCSIYPTELNLQTLNPPYHLTAYTNWSLLRKISFDIGQCPVISMIGPLHVDDPTCIDIIAVAKSLYILSALFWGYLDYCTEGHLYCSWQNEMTISEKLYQPPLMAKNSYSDYCGQLLHYQQYFSQLAIEHLEHT